MDNPYRFAEARASSFTKLDRFQQQSIQFIKAVRETYGAEKASAVVSSLGESLGKEWSNKLIYDMVVGPEMLLSEADIVVSSIKFTHIIPMIKAIRAASGMGLKEAKDAVEGLRERTNSWLPSSIFTNVMDAPTLIIPFKPNYGDMPRESFLKDLREVGFHVHE